MNKNRIHKIIKKYSQSPTDYSIFCFLSDFIAELSHISSTSAICDVGCGHGKYSKFLSNMGYKNISAIDPSPYAGFEYDGVNFFRLSAASFSTEINRSFDLVLCIDVIEHCEDDLTFFSDIVRLLRPGGWLVLVAPAKRSLFSVRDKIYGHYRRYEQEQIREFFTHGFSDVNICLLGWSIFVKVAALLTPKRRGNEYRLDVQTQKSSEFKPPKVGGFAMKFLNLFGPIFYSADAILANSRFGCEFFVTARKM